MGWGPWIAVAAIGGIVGSTELAQRCRDRPAGPLHTLPGNIDIAVNILSFGSSEFFTVRLRNTDLPLGPAAILQVILNASDRACDPRRAAQRPVVVAVAVAAIMQDVDFNRAREALPAHCLKLMQNVSQEEADALRGEVKALGALRAAFGSVVPEASLARRGGLAATLPRPA